MNEAEIKQQYDQLTETLHDLFIEKGYSVHVIIGTMAGLITSASAGTTSKVGVEQGDQEFYSLLNVMEKAYAAGTEDMRKGVPDGETLQ